MESHRIAIISDTHGLLRPEVVEEIKSCEAVFHGGDMDCPEILEQLKCLRPTYAVRGNADRDWAAEVPETLETQVHGFQIFMIHNRKLIQKDLTEFDIVIYGHSHEYKEEQKGRTRYLNPGSCGRRRFSLPVTMMILTLYPEAHEISVEKIDLTERVGGPGKEKRSEGWFFRKKERQSEQDMHRLVISVMKAMDAGKPVPAIVSETGAEACLAEQICRMYATHPGVDVDGILDRISPTILQKNRAKMDSKDRANVLE